MPATKSAPPPTESTLVEASKEAAAEAGLRYVTNRDRGIRRVRSGKGFRYVDADGRAVKDAATLERIKSLVLPPAWNDVWICPRANGHLQAVGVDERGRTQYRYHPKWREVRDEAKFDRMLEFGKALPKIRKTVDKHLAQKGLPREKVLAAVVRLLETSLIRVGNDEYATTNRSYGLTTLRNKHVKTDSGVIRFTFRGKSGIDHEIEVADRRLAKIVAQCQDLPGQELFEYLDEEEHVRDVTSQDVNDYLKEITGKDFTAKDFRTWAGTVLATLALQEFEAFDSEAQAKRNIREAIKSVSSRLGNTPTVCRKCYIHPRVLDSYLEGTMLDALQRRAAKEMKELKAHEPEEAAVLALLQRRLADEKASDRKK